MEISSFPQWQIFLICLAWGIPCGVFYDFFRFLRKAGLNSKTAVAVQDIIFMCLCAVWLFLLACALNFGIVRVYMALGFFGGALIYRFTVGIFSGRLLDFLVLNASRIFGKVKRLIKTIFSFFCKQTGKITVIFCSLHKNYKEKSKNTLKDKTNKVYNYKKQTSAFGLRLRRAESEGSRKGDCSGKKTKKKT